MAQQNDLGVLPCRRSSGDPQPRGYLDGEKEHESAGTPDAIIRDREALLQVGGTTMTCPYEVFGNYTGAAFFTSTSRPD